MIKISKKFINIFNIFIVLTFLINALCYGQTQPISQQDNLAPHTIFQKSFPTEISEGFKDSIISDTNLIAVCLSIAKHYLIDNGDKEDLLRCTRNRIRNLPIQLKLLDELASGTSFKTNKKGERIVVIIPYKRGNQKYMVKIYAKDKIRYVKKPNSEWGVFDKYGYFKEFGDFGMQVVPSTQRQETTETIVGKLIQRKKVIVTTDNNEDFIFTLVNLKDYGKKYFTIKVSEKNGNPIGFIEVKGNTIHRAFYNSKSVAAISVDQAYKEKYSGIGRSLMALAMGVTKFNKFKMFYVEEPGDNALGFYTKLGFREVSGLEDLFSFNLITNPLPKIEIRLKKTKKDLKSLQAKKAKQNMLLLHKANMELMPPVDKGKTLVHVIPREILPPSIRSSFEAMVRDLYNMYPNSKEKIMIVNHKDLHESVEALINKKQEHMPDYIWDENTAYIVDVAALYKKDLIGLHEDVKGLVFEGTLGGAYGFRQLEGILAALRALHNADRRYAAMKLIEIHKLIAGNEIQGNMQEIKESIDNPEELAKYILFKLKPITIDEGEDLRLLNNNLLELIKSA